MDHLATVVLSHITANAQQLTLTAITVVEEGTSKFVAVGRDVVCASALLHKEERPFTTWTGSQHLGFGGVPVGVRPVVFVS